MRDQFLGLRTRTWIAGIVVLALAGTLALAAGSLTRDGAKQAANHAAWYSDTGTEQENDHSAVPTRSGAEKSAGRETSYANSLSNAFRQAAERVLPSVVTITNRPALVEAPQGKNPLPEDPFEGTPFDDFFGSPEMRRFFKDLPGRSPSVPRRGVQGMGSGVIVDESGVILTNNHVVEGGGKLTVRLQDGREFDAVEVKQDPKTDLAVVRIEGAGPIEAARLGNSDAAEVGDWVLALGQPFGLEGTVTAGIISAKGRGIGITARENFIQTDAAINPGNSGGPLVNLDGQVVGINTAISSRSGGYQGVGFAIPVNLAKWVGGQLVENGTVRRAYLGVMIQPVTQQLAEQFGVKVREGVLVTAVQPDTPAADAGLKAGDVIVACGGDSVASPNQLQGIVERCSIDTKQTLAVVRDGKRITLGVTLREQPSDDGPARKGVATPKRTQPSRFNKLGIQLDTLTAEVAEQLDMKGARGVVITDVRSGSPAGEAGLTAGMVLTQVNRKPVGTVDDFQKALEERSLDEGVLLLVRTAKGGRFVVVRSAK